MLRVHVCECGLCLDVQGTETLDAMILANLGIELGLGGKQHDLSLLVAGMHKTITRSTNVNVCWQSLHFFLAVLIITLHVLVLHGAECLQYVANWET